MITKQVISLLKKGKVRQDGSSTTELVSVLLNEKLN